MTVRLWFTIPYAAIGLLGMVACLGRAESTGSPVLGLESPPMLMIPETGPFVAVGELGGQSPNVAAPRPDDADQPRAGARSAGPAASVRVTPDAVRRRNRFALALYRRVAESSRTSLSLSPSGVYEALTLLAPGARGETATQIASVLDASPDGHPAEAPRPESAVGASNPPAVGLSVPVPSLTDPARVAVELASVADKSPDSPPVKGAQLLSANALWLQIGLTFVPEYRKVVEKPPSAMLAGADFSGDPVRARRIINAWVAGQTGQMIKELLSSDMVDGSTRLLITNAVCFRAAWGRPFEVANTGDHPFRVSDTIQLPVPMMNQVGVFPFLEADGLQIVELPYDGGAFSMVIVATQLGALRKLESQLSEPKLTEYVSRLKPSRLELSIPRFKLGSIPVPATIRTSSR